MQTESAVADAIRTAYESRTPLYPVGGGTSLDFGGTIPADGQRLKLSGLKRVVDYTPRDMTIVAEAGVRMTELAATLAAEGQQLPIDVPRAVEATLGGVVATNWSGSRRLGHGTIRDYVIGIHAVDGRGVAFKGGGRVVKNVAGYDFCKLLTGSLGTIGVITQLALKVKPLPEDSATLVANCQDQAKVDAVLRRLLNLVEIPVVIDVLAGDAWNQVVAGGTEQRTTTIVVRVEGTAAETAWMAEHVQYEFWQGGATSVMRLPADQAESLAARQIEFTERGAAADHDGAALVLKVAVPPSATLATIADLRAHDGACTIQAHAASGIVVARFADFAAGDVSKFLLGKLRPTAIERGGSVVVLQTKLEGLTPHILWGNRTDATILMERVKREFDPHNILNPGRFVF